MKILILTQYFPPEVGAPQNRLYELAVRLKEKGAEITVMTAMPNYPQMEIHKVYLGKRICIEEMDGMKIIRSGIYVSKKKGMIRRLRNYFSFVISSYFAVKKHAGEIDIIICESPPLFLGMTAMRLKRIKKAKLIFNVSDLWPESAERLGIVKNRLLLGMAYRLERKIYSRSELITGQTQGIVKNILQRFPEKKAYWLPNGVDLSIYDHNSVRSSWRSENGFSETDLIFLYAGILGHAQGLEVILDAALSLIDKQNIKFVLAGSGPVKQDLLYLKEMRELPNVFFLDTIPKSKMPALIGACDASIIPLKRLDIFKGAIPSKIFECLAMKKPILLGVEGEAKELFIEEGKCGLAFEPENGDDLVRKIIQLAADRKLAGELGENGYNYVSKKFNRNDIADKFWQVITSLG